MQVCSPTEATGDVQVSSSITYALEMGSFTELSPACWKGMMASDLLGSNCLFPQMLGLQAYAAMSRFFMWVLEIVTQSLWL